MRLYLDTNIIVYFLFNRGELATNVSEMLFDYSNALFASSVCVHEMIHLSQIGKVQMVAKGKRKLVDPQKIIESIHSAGIEITAINERHLATLASLSMHDEHRDPNDRLIIAQAMADRVPLISSDHKFGLYVKDGLQWVFNRR